MPWLPLYADQSDFQQILDWLNRDPEIAFIISVGEGRWIATDELPQFPWRRQGLWHIPSGPLPLMPSDSELEAGAIEDPWTGWTELTAAGEPGVPWFGNHLGIIWLNVRPQGREPLGVGLSSFEWIGNYFAAIGKTAPPPTERWWKRLRTQVKKSAVRIPRRGPLDGPKPEIWALFSAHARIAMGAGRDTNPF